MPQLKVPFFLPDIGDLEVGEVMAVLRSGWLTTGPRVRRFEQDFAAAVRAPYAIAVNSCTAALHLAVEAVGLKAGEGVLVPTMTFAATAEVVRYLGAVPILVDCDPVTGHMDLQDAARKIDEFHHGKLPATILRAARIVGIMPVHVGGLMMNIADLQQFASAHQLWIVEDAAHAFPAAWRRSPDDLWHQCGESGAAVSCFSFYANKTITTGEGGMVVTHDTCLAERMRLMSLHGLSHDAWGRYSGGGTWDYQILAPGYKYNLTDIAAAIGLHQVVRAEEMRRRREVIALRYQEGLGNVDEVEAPPVDANRIHSWHLFPIRLRTERLAITRNAFKEELQQRGVGSSVHWRPLHLHPYYRETFGWQPQDFPAATGLWDRLLSLPIFSRMTDEQVEYVIGAVKRVCAQSGRRPPATAVYRDNEAAAPRVA